MKATRAEGVAFFKLDENKKTILITGGSLGARSINEAMAACIDELEKRNLQLIWQTGTGYAEQAATLSTGKKHIYTSAFIKEMDMAFAAADVVVSRAGAMAMAELCVVKKPVVFVPYPHAAEDHQTANAQALVAQNAALMIKDNELQQQFADTVFALAADEQKQHELITNIGKLAVTDADERIATTILNILEKGLNHA
jgi:UDP-N-acetylglucosamine--N-acetylmuramyl-(pentapeptide) pyrophosphoryl-undecaprenol N-acetylglucosamine transferase